MARTISKQLHSAAFRQLARMSARFVLVSTLTISLTLIVANTRAHAHDEAPLGSVSLTQDLVSLNARYHRAAPAEQAQLLNDLRTIADNRQQVLTGLIEDHPEEVLRIAVPAHIRAALSPAIQAYIEQEVEIEGELEVQVEDRDDGHRYRYFLDTASERFSLHFAADPPIDLLTGSHVRVNGVQVDGALALSSGSSSVQTQSLALQNTFGAQKTVVLLVNFQDEPTQLYTMSDAQDVFTTTSNFYLENSFQQTWLTGVVDPTKAADVYGWFTLPMSYFDCDPTNLALYAEQAAKAAGIRLSSYTHHVYAFPDNSCTWWGLGTVGGNPSKAWINGGLTYRVTSHEMGHNFGLYHSHSLECGTVTLGSNCTVFDYGDTLDIMGNSIVAGHFNAFQKEQLGWLNYQVSPPITTVQTGGVYSIDPYESQSSNPKALKILEYTDPTTGQQTWYYVEFRQALGFDNFLSTYSNVLNGVVVHLGSPPIGTSSDLLDMTPDTSSWSDPALDVGQSFYDPNTGVTITPLSVGSTGATVSVSFGPLTCAPANPTVTLSPSATQWAPPGASVTYTVTVIDKDNSGCSTTNFALQAAAPSGWTAALGASALSLSSGGSASTTLTVTSPTSAANGFYDVGVTAANSTNATYSASTSVSISLAPALSVTVATDKATYSRGQTVFSSATVTSSGSPVANASVTFTLTTANGSVVTNMGTTGTNGVATFSYRLRKQDPTGSYKVQGSANFNGISGSGSTSITVQ